jgi:outer membrane protein TolC
MIQLEKLLGADVAAGHLRFATMSASDLAKIHFDFPTESPDTKNSYIYKLREIEAKAGEQNLELIRRKNGLEINLTSGATYTNGQYLNSDDPFYARDQVTWNILLGARYNLWDAGTRRRDIQIAASENANADLEAQNQLAELRADMATLMNELNRLKTGLDLSRELINLEEENHRRLDEEYRQGRASYLDLINGLGDLLTARTSYYSSLTSILEHLARYRYYQGTLYEYVTTR